MVIVQNIPLIVADDNGGQRQSISSKRNTGRKDKQFC